MNLEPPWPVRVKDSVLNAVLARPSLTKDLDALINHLWTEDWTVACVEQCRGYWSPQLRTEDINKISLSNDLAHTGSVLKSERIGLDWKEKGNEFFGQGNLASAITCYNYVRLMFSLNSSVLALSVLV